MARLRRDAQGLVVPVDQPLPAAGSMSAPGDWEAVAGRDFRGVARFLRRFGRPTGIEPHDRVVLVVERVGGRASIYLQGEKLADAPPCLPPLQFDLTDRLLVANELWIDVEWLGEATTPAADKIDSTESVAGGSIGEVRLEIREPYHGYI